MNSVRVPLVRRALLESDVAAAGTKAGGQTSLQGYRIVDIGCGGGILSQPLRRLGAEVLGIDAASANISAALHQAKKDPALLQPASAGRSTPGLHFECITAEALAEREPASFDAVVASEVIEHVQNVPAFFSSCAKLLKPGGALVLTTMNRTPQAFFAAILGAEYVLRLVPAGTHEWSKFLSPEELLQLSEGNGLQERARGGLLYNPLTGKWSFSKDNLSVNYFFVASKPRAEAAGQGTAAAGGTGAGSAGAKQ